MNIVLCLLVFLVFSNSRVSAKLCCDQECKKPVSYGRTKDRYITQEDGHLSFPNAAIVTILIKQAAFDTSGQELWFAEIQGRKGLVPAQVVTELHTLCDPKPVEEVLYDSTNIPQSSSATSHTTDAMHEQQQEPPHTNSQQADNLYVTADEEQVNVDVEGKSNEDSTSTEEHNKSYTDDIIREEGREFVRSETHNNKHTIDQHNPTTEMTMSTAVPSVISMQEETEWSLGLGPFPKPEERLDSEHRLASELVEYIYFETPNNDIIPEDTTLRMAGGYNHDSTLDVPFEITNHDIQEGHSDGNRPGSTSMRMDGGHNHKFTLEIPSEIVDNSIQESYSNGNEPESAMVKRDDDASDEGLHRISQPSSHYLVVDNTIDANAELQVSHSNVYATPTSSFVSNNTPNEDPEEGLEPDTILSYKTLCASEVEDTAGPVEDSSTVGIGMERSQHLPLHTPPPAYPAYESPALEVKPTVANLRNGEHVQVKPVGGRSVQVTAGDGTMRIVDYEYFNEEGSELPGVGDYNYLYDDADIGTEKEETEERRDAELKPVSENNLLAEVELKNAGFPSNQDGGNELMNSNEIERTQETELNPPGPSTTMGDSAGNQQVHSYLDVQSLRQRYGKGGDVSDVERELQEAFSSDDIKITSVMDVNQHKHAYSEQTGITRVTQQIVPYTSLPDTSLQPISPSEGMEVLTQINVHLEPISQTSSATDIPEEDLHHQVTHVLLPDMEQVSQQHWLSQREKDFLLPSQEPSLPVNHMQGSLILENDVKASQQQLEPHASIVNLIGLFSPQLAERMDEQVPEFGIVGIFTSALCLVVPLCCFCCHFWKDSRKKATTISKHTACRKGLEEQIEKLKEEKKTVKAELELIEEKYGGLDNELQEMKHNNKALTEATVDMEKAYENVCGDLHSLQQELSACTTDINQLRSELKQEQIQLSSEKYEKEVALQQVALLQDEIRECNKNVQELQAAKEQLEQDSFFLHNSYQKLEDAHQQVVESMGSSQSENEKLKSRVHALQEDLCSLQQAKNDNAEEIQTLQNCLSQFLVTTADETDQEVEKVDGGTKVYSADTLLKVQAMLDTTKVQGELKAVTEERDKNNAALEEQSKLLKNLQEENKALHGHTTEIEAQLSDYTAEYQKLQDKHRTLTEYFEQKEHNLHRMLGAEEAVRQAVETREAKVKEKAQSLEQTEARHREELKQLRSEMFEIEKSLMSQVHACQKRAEDAIVEQRRLEQECKALRLERDDLRKRIGGKSVSLLGASSDRQHSLIARPPSAPYLPRTSSPGVCDADTDDMTTLLSQTDPLPCSQQQPAVPNLGPEDPSPYFPPRGTRFSPFQPPLQHPHPQQPRYPVPPHGHRLIRGYPPFHRRPPRPGVYGPVTRFYQDIRERVPEKRRPLSNPPPGAVSTPLLGDYDPHTSSNVAGFVPVVPVVPEPPFPIENCEGEKVSL